MLTIYPNIKVQSPPPTKPSHVFLGDILGKSVCFPILEPNKYANESLVHMRHINNKQKYLGYEAWCKVYEIYSPNGSPKYSVETNAYIFL